MEEIIHHLAVFVSRLWQIHIFGEENTRATAVFLIKYLRTLGFSATNDIFAKNAWYFRNALVPANYTNLQKGIHETTEYLEVFLRNLLRLYIRRTGSNSKCISSDNYTSAVKKELQQLSTFSQIKEIRDKELNSVILSHLEMSEDLVEGIVQWKYGGLCSFLIEHITIFINSNGCICIKYLFCYNLCSRFFQHFCRWNVCLHICYFYHFL